MDRDSIGRFNGTNERVYDSSGSLLGETFVDTRLSPGINSLSDGSVVGAVGLSEAMAASLKAKQCFARVSYHFMSGRPNHVNDGCHLQAAVDAINSGKSLADALKALILAPEFRLYQPENGL